MDFYKLKEKLLNKDNIISREKYKSAGVMVLIAELNGKDYFVLQKRAKNITQGGEISFPGGRYDESDKSYLETSLREVEEEMGISRERIKVVGKLGTLIVPTGIIVESYVGMIDLKSKNEFKVQDDEVERVIYFPLEEALNQKPRIEMLTTETHPYYEKDGKVYEFPAEALNLPEKYHKSWKSPPRKVYIYSYKNDIIWGITADLIFETLKMLE
ncbi:MAG: CoA pyrophosphatase [Cetobacterium sp.]|uniref:NUDIX hydrolase n=1 Tax=unclassified Cetobacterium TaxID=2630983 RepID=UPI00163D2CB3|nr:CoA pyrophosphatase [Cetobacterium sp. 2A]MBC2855911.1 CoA pyrophosphatase [Cetobacterium sp. 2A]